MPQLNLDLWFIVFIMFWLMFLTKMLPHASKFKLLGSPPIQQTYNKLNHWNWPLT